MCLANAVSAWRGGWGYRSIVYRMHVMELGMIDGSACYGRRRAHGDGTDVQLVHMCVQATALGCASFAPSRPWRAVCASAAAFGVR